MIFSAEWTYLLTTRKVAGDDSAFSWVRLEYGQNPTDTVSGMIIYPDDFSFADAGVGAMSFGIYTPVQIDIDAWEALEDAGCIFLPSSPTRYYDAESRVVMAENSAGVAGLYWTATANTSTSSNVSSYANAMRFHTSLKSMSVGGYSRYTGYYVRLAQDY